MTDTQKLYSGISKAAWGYFFLYFNININNISVLPNFVGYLLFLSSINLLQDEERELSLLRTLGVILALWTGAGWLFSLVGLKVEGLWQFMDILISLVNLYFHFQLLTNLAAIAAKYQPEGEFLDAKLLRYRTLQTLMLTAIEIIICFQPWFSAIWTVISFCMLLVYVIAGICLMKALFDLRKCFSAA